MDPRGPRGGLIGQLASCRVRRVDWAGSSSLSLVVVARGAGSPGWRREGWRAGVLGGSDRKLGE